MSSLTNQVRSATFALAGLLIMSHAGYTQSTFGTVLGAVRDPSGSFVPKVKVQLINAGTNATRDDETGTDGRYQFNNVDVGNYQLRVEATGFQTTTYQPFDLAARDTKRVDIDLQLASQAATVTVEAVAIVQTEVSNVAETKGSLELTDLPVAITTRAAGSTSAFSTLTAQPGVQIDANNNIAVAGAGPSQLSVSVDGISTVGPGQLGALAELFPSFNSIEEIKISETLNPAEFGGVADITTVSKSGTNEFHGGLFENVQNTAFDAADTFSHIVTPVKMNDFGAFLGGPVIFPKLYNGRNKTFFFGSYEVLRLPKSQRFIQTVPTQAMRNGDLSAYLDPSKPGGGPDNALTSYPGNIIPKSALNPFGQSLLNFFYPLPNYGPPGAIVNNYLDTYATPINSAQGDIRVDQVISPKHSIYVRYSYKNRRVTNYPTDLSGSPGSPLLGETENPQVYNSMTAAYNWIISPSLVNELRGGFSKYHEGFTTGITSAQAATQLGLQVGPGELPGPIPGGDAYPTINLLGFLSARPSGTAYTTPRQGTDQILDTLTWTKSRHTFKFGGDYRHLEALFTQVFADYRFGQFNFNGSSLYNFFNPAATTAEPVDPIAGLLTGYPDATGIATVTNPATDAWAYSLGFFAQDDYKISRSFTLNYGLRWEYHPGFWDSQNNISNFDPYYSSTIGGQTVKGAVIVPNQAGFANVNPNFTAAIAPVPVISAAQAGVPSNLRYSSKRDFAPRIGFAWNIGSDRKTVLRGGYGRFIEALLSATAIAGWATAASDLSSFSNSVGPNGTPVFSLPYSYPSNIVQPGTQFFDVAAEVKYKDPVVEEWNLTLERDLGHGIGVRASYDGNHAHNLPVNTNYNQPPANTVGFFAPSTQAAIPYPSFLILATSSNLGFSNYNAGTFSVRKRSSSIQFELSYTYARDLSNLGGCAVQGAQRYANEFGVNTVICNPAQPGQDYGNVSYTRRNRFLATFLYQLPFGRGKAFLNNANGVANHIVGGWVLSGVALFQTGPYMNVATTSDPSGTGFNIFGGGTFGGIGGRADSVRGVSPTSGQSLAQWINPAAFTDPCANCGVNGNPEAIGRFGDSEAGAVQGPGTQAVSLSLLKRFIFTERMRLEFGAQVANVFNHANYAPPGQLTLGLPGFGTITGMQNAEGAGPRQIQLTGRFTF
ncbi:MAG TPA: carboxypeptidase-like regulatory domain-containing protein [Bryobacteraceae bacterium]|jgi:hypothetical protein